MFNREIDTIKGPNQNLQWLIVGSFRYAVNRHGTQCMWGIEDLIKDNIDCLDDCFIEQFIRAIQDEQRLERLSREWEQEEKENFWERLQGHLKDYIRYLKDMPTADCQDACKMLEGVLKMTKLVEVEKHHHIPWRQIDDTSYLNPLLEFLQQEYERRGHHRIVPRD